MEKDPSQKSGAREARTPERESLSRFKKVGKFASRLGGVVHPKVGIATGYMFGLSREQMGYQYDKADRAMTGETEKKTPWGRFRRGFKKLFGTHMVEDPRRSGAGAGPGEAAAAAASVPGEAPKTETVGAEAGSGPDAAGQKSAGTESAQTEYGAGSNTETDADSGTEPDSKTSKKPGAKPESAAPSPASRSESGSEAGTEVSDSPDAADGAATAGPSLPPRRHDRSVSSLRHPAEAAAVGAAAGAAASELGDSPHGAAGESLADTKTPPEARRDTGAAAGEDTAEASGAPDADETADTTDPSDAPETSPADTTPPPRPENPASLNNLRPRSRFRRPGFAAGAVTGATAATPYSMMSTAERAAFNYGSRAEALARQKRERLLASAAIIGGAAFLYERHRRKKSVAELSRDNKKLNKRVNALDKQLSGQQAAASMPRQAESAPPMPPAPNRQPSQPAQPNLARTSADMLIAPIPIGVRTAAETAPRPISHRSIETPPLDRLRMPENASRPDSATSPNRAELPPEPPRPPERFEDKLPLLIPILPPQPNLERSQLANAQRIQEQQEKESAARLARLEYIPKPVLEASRPEIRPVVDSLPVPIPIPVPNRREALPVPDQTELRPSMQAAEVQRDIEQLVERSRQLPSPERTAEIPLLTPADSQRRRDLIDRLERQRADPEAVARELAKPETRRLLSSQEILRVEQKLVRERQHTWRNYAGAGDIAGAAVLAAKSAGQKLTSAAKNPTGKPSKDLQVKSRTNLWPASLVFALILAALVYAWLAR